MTDKGQKTKPSGGLPGGLSVCRSCGACCARHRVLLNWTEVDDFGPTGVPVGMTVSLSEHLRIMAGTDRPPGRCVALDGQIGHFVSCRIYEQRGSQCREFNPIGEDGEPNDACARARRAYGLGPIPPEK